MVTYRMILLDGSPADPPTLRSAVPDWKPGHTIPRGPGKPRLLVLGVHADNDHEHDGVLIVTPDS